MHHYSLRLLSLPDPPIFPRDAATARSTTILQGCCHCQIHPHSVRLLPLPDPPLFFKAAATAISTLFIQGYFPLQSNLFVKIVTSARSTIIIQGCCSCQIHPHYSVRLLPLPDPPLFFNAGALPYPPLSFKAAAPARSTLIIL